MPEPPRPAERMLIFVLRSFSKPFPIDRALKGTFLASSALVLRHKKKKIKERDKSSDSKIYFFLSAHTYYWSAVVKYNYHNTFSQRLVFISSTVLKSEFYPHQEIT